MQFNDSFSTCYTTKLLFDDEHLHSDCIFIFLFSSELDRHFFTHEVS